MSAFNDYCIVCEKLCSSHSVYCSDVCKLKDNDSHFNFHNAPQLISPVLQPRADSYVSQIDAKVENENEEEEEEEDDDIPVVHDYLIKSPLLLSSNIKDHGIAGLSLDNDILNTQSKNIPINNKNKNQPNRNSVMQNSAGNKLNQQSQPASSDILASSSNYKKWLNVVL
ncbi:hypothetical protein WICPIJ_000827 [Wickerhamomyces pijperi]|uniref:Uncharacterized protein n=1 Tax=Wickerhamomyces pijperi TaxID=599730 RepID=A0A9P8QEY1_WICPI|nr:hypothetical protein WICPIJ_000827 [Wickerhamomyces pijperi]